jgi:ABC-type spermidine/putrescine transport system permease subunit I
MGTIIYQLMISTLNWPYGSATAFILLGTESIIIFFFLKIIMPVTQRGRKV